MFDIENSLGFLLAKVHQRGWALFSEKLAGYELTPPQFALLAFLWREDGLTQSELSEKSQVDRTTIGGLVDRLERLAMLQRHPHPHDRRAYQIKLTAKGKGLENELCRKAEEASNQFTTGLSREEQKELNRMLTIMRGEREIYEKPCF